VIRRRTSVLVALIGILTLAGSLAACGSNSPASSTTPRSAAASSPASSRSSGTADSAAGLYAYNGNTPPTSGPKAAKGKTLWIISCGQAASGCANTTADIQQAGQAIGWKALICDGKFDVNDAYGGCITQGLADHVSGIALVSGFDCDLIEPQLKAAKAAGIPVVANQSVDCNDPLSTVKGPALFTSLEMSDQYPNVQQWMFARGESMAKYILAKTGGNAQIIDEHFVGQLLGVYLDNGLLAGLKSCSGCKVVDSVSINNAVLAEGQDHQLMATAAVQHPSANVIAYAFSSFVQSSQLQAIASQMGNHPLVVGGEGEPNNLALISSGASVPTAEVGYNGPQLGWALVDEMNRIFAGQPTVPEGIGWVMADKDHNLPASSRQYYNPPYNFTAIYKKSWGVS
jgi:ribose transport system substrate-binding protein